MEKIKVEHIRAELSKICDIDWFEQNCKEAQGLEDGFDIWYLSQTRISSIEGFVMNFSDWYYFFNISEPTFGDFEFWRIVQMRLMKKFMQGKIQPMRRFVLLLKKAGCYVSFRNAYIKQMWPCEVTDNTFRDINADDLFICLATYYLTSKYCEYDVMNILSEFESNHLGISYGGPCMAPYWKCMHAKVLRMTYKNRPPKF